METESPFDALRKELGAKLPEARYCELATCYEACDPLPEVLSSLEHLATEHNSQPAAELLCAVVAYILHGSQLEAELFAQYKIVAAPRFDVAINSRALVDAHALVQGLRVPQGTRH